MLSLRNPHSILAAFRQRPKSTLTQEVSEVRISEGVQSDLWEDVQQQAKRLGLRMGGGQKLPKGVPGEVLIREKDPVDIEDLFTGEDGLWLALDGLQDPHNVGAIFRTAAFFGVKGVLMTKERSAPLSATVYDIASGGLETLPFAFQSSFHQAFEVAKKKGLWILGSTEHQGDDYRSIELDRPWLLVLGNEEKGMRRLTTDSCDVLCRIPAQGQVTSLNVSVAAGILISHFVGSVPAHAKS